MGVRTEAIRAPVAAVTADASLAWRRAALWGLLGAKVVSSWGVQWDIQWHTLIGRDSFWIAPHLMTYAGVVVMVGLSFGVLAATTDRKSTRLNSSHSQISYAVFCLKKKTYRIHAGRQST